MRREPLEATEAGARSAFPRDLNRADSNAPKDPRGRETRKPRRIATGAVQYL
jgi:hypothetical protein